MKNQWRYRLLLLLMILVGIGTLILTIGVPDSVDNGLDFSLVIAEDRITLQYAGHTVPLEAFSTLPGKVDISDWYLQCAQDGSAIRLDCQDNSILICTDGKLMPEPARTIVLPEGITITEEALEIVQPEFAVLQGSAPDSSLLKVLDQHCKAVYRVDLQGTVTLNVTEEKIKFATEKAVSSKELFPHRADSSGLSVREYDYQYVINVRSSTFHSPLCTNLEKMNEGNKSYSSESKEDLIAQGYRPCNNCLPTEE